MIKEKYPLYGYGNNLDEVQIITLEEVDSTNNYARELSVREIREEFVVVMAQAQTSGRGQRGNSWESEPGKNLLFSIRMNPVFLEVGNQFLLSQAMALSVQEVLYDYVRSPYPRIKWPNDIYWNKKKLGGILIETDLIGRQVDTCIIGVGVNLNQEHFVSDAPNPISVRKITGYTCEPSTILHKILQRFIYYYRQIEEGDTDSLIARYHKALFRQVGYHKYRDSNGLFEARIHRVEFDGHLVLEDLKGAMRTYGFKEVECVL